MHYTHRCDNKLPQWLDNLVEGKIQKKASSVNTVFMPYGMSERATQLKSNVLDDALESINPDSDHPIDLCDEEQDDKNKIVDEQKAIEVVELPGEIEPEALEEKQDEDIKQKIENAKTPEELEKLEKELESGGDSSEETPSEEAPKEETEAPVTDEAKPKGESEETPAEGGDEVSQLKQEIKDLKEQVDELSGEEQMQHEIDQLKKELKNIKIQDDADLNDSIYQEASEKVAYCKRCMRRITSGVTNEQ